MVKEEKIEVSENTSFNELLDIMEKSENRLLDNIIAFQGSLRKTKYIESLQEQFNNEIQKLIIYADLLKVKIKQSIKKREKEGNPLISDKSDLLVASKQIIRPLKEALEYVNEVLGEKSNDIKKAKLEEARLQLIGSLKYLRVTKRALREVRLM